MKKLSKAFALFAAVAMLGTGFFSCSSDDSGSSGPAKASGEKLVETRVSVNTEAAAGTVTLDDVTKESIAAALAAITDSADHVIELTEGTYKEDGLRYQGGANITIKGPATDNPYGAKVLILGKGANMDSEGGNQAGRELLEIAGSGNVILENIALWNNFTKDGDCQAEAFGFDSTGTAAAYNCSFISRQDTTRTTGKAWFYKCYVEGDVDFLWMESSGKVALYEDCRLRAVTGRKKAGKQVDAFFTAPRVNVVDEATYGKGLVIFNSKVEVEDNLTTYLFRNPWGNNSAYYNNVAVVDSTLYGAVVKEPLWKNAPMYDRLNPCGGFLTNMTGLSNMDAALVSKEYTGRNNILNRVYDSETNVMCKDFANEWSLSALETEFNATADTSASLLPGEKVLVMKELNFVATANAMTSEDPVDTTEYKAQQANISQSKKSHGYWMAAAANSQSGVDSYLVLKNVPKYCKITFYSCQYGAGAGTVTGPNGFTSDFECNKTLACGAVGGAFVYNGGVEGDLTITFTSGNAWVHGVFIREYESLTPATGITISAPKTQIYTDEAVQLSATIAPSDVTLKAQKWTSSDPTTVYVSDKGLIMGMKVGTATITVATKDGTAKTDSVEITVVEKTAKPVAGKSYSYPMQGGVGCPYFSSDMLFQCKGDSDNGSHGLVMKDGSKAIVDVAGNVKVTLYRCRYDNPGVCTVTDKDGNTIAIVNFPQGAGGGVADTDTLEYVYIGPATTLTMTWKTGKGANYLHRVDVDPLGSIKPVTAINVIAADSATTIAKGGNLQLTTDVTPANASTKVVKWSSSDTSIATVDNNGLVTGLALGNVTITATAIDGSNVTGTINLEVVSTFVPQYTFDFKKADFRGADQQNTTLASEEDATANITFSKGFGYNGGYGFQSVTGSTLQVAAAGPVKVYIYQSYTKNCGAVDIAMYTVDGGVKSSTAVQTIATTAGLDLKTEADLEANKIEFVYTGSETVLQFDLPGNLYATKVVVKNLVKNTFDFKKADFRGSDQQNTTLASEEDATANITFSKGFGYNGGYGFQSVTGSTLQVAVAGNAKVYIYQSYTKNCGAVDIAMYTVDGGTKSADAVQTISTTAGLDLKTEADLEANKIEFTYTGSATVLQFDLPGNLYATKVVSLSEVSGE